MHSSLLKPIFVIQYMTKCRQMLIITVNSKPTQVQSPRSTSWRKLLNCFMACDGEKEIEKWYKYRSIEEKRRRSESCLNKSLVN